MVPSVDMVRLVSSGTEATMSAIRLARGVTGRPKIVKFEGCYHGHSDALLARAGSGLATFGLPGSAGVTPGATRDTIVLPYNDLSGAEAAFERAGSDVAAIIVDHDPYPELRSTAERLVAGVCGALEAAGVSATVNRVESLFSLFFGDEPVRTFVDARAADHATYARFFHAMLDQGIALPPSGYEAWFLSTAHGDAEIERTIQAAERAARAAVSG